jgi:hypothetical protein
VNYAVWTLLRLYDEYEPFLEDCRVVKGTIAGAGDYDRMRLTRDLARRWNLERIPQLRESGYRQLSRAIDRLDTQTGTIVCRVFYPFSIVLARFEPENPAVVYEDRRWEWRLGGQESLAGMRQRIMNDLDLRRASQLPPDVLRQLRVLPGEARKLGWEISDQPSELPKHVRWLFLRLCPHPETPWGYSRIAAAEIGDDKAALFVDKRMVRRTVISLAKAIGVELPPLSPGRPRTLDLTAK